LSRSCELLGSSDIAMTPSGNSILERAMGSSSVQSVSPVMVF